MHALRDFGQRSCHTATCRTFATSAAHDDVESYSVHSNANNKAIGAVRGAFDAIIAAMTRHPDDATVKRCFEFIVPSEMR